MRRDVDMLDISDGKIYGLNDMVKADCGDCNGCSSCCYGRGDTITLDPFDMIQLIEVTGLSYEQLLEKRIGLSVVDHVILPHLKMTQEGNHCSFLEEGRCGIHGHRPGMCRIFPLGRIYEERSFQYFLQTKECIKTNRSKIKVSKWIAAKNLKANQKFIADWHFFLKDVEEMLLNTEEEGAMKNTSMYILHTFFIRPYGGMDTFYDEITERIEQGREALGV